MKKRMLSILLSAIMIVSLLPAAVFAAEEPTGLDNFKKIRTYSDGQLTDVNTTDWFYKNVASVYEFDLMIGRSDTEFAPEENMTVAEAMTIAARMHAIYHTGTATFTQGLPWYQVYTDYCRANGIADPDDYDLNTPVTRAQFAEIIANAFPSEAFSAVNRVDDDMIPDVKTADEFGAAVYMLYRAGVLTGNDDKGTFAPDSNILRMEAAAIITRMVDPSLRESVRLARETSGGGGRRRPPKPDPAETQYTVYYREFGTDIALTTEPDRGVGVAGTVVPLNARTINGYNVYGVQVGSGSIQQGQSSTDLTLSAASEDNVVTFWYSPMSPVETTYYVYYKDFDSKEEVYSPPLIGYGVAGDDVPLSARTIDGYFVYGVQVVGEDIQLRQSSVSLPLYEDPNKNVVTFWYKRDIEL